MVNGKGVVLSSSASKENIKISFSGPENKCIDTYTIGIHVLATGKMAANMSTNQDITQKSKLDTESSVSEQKTENQTARDYAVLIPHHAYGHLQWEYRYGDNAPDDWVNPYSDNYEPVKPEGADMFHSQGLNYGFICYKLNVEARVNFYIFDDLEEWMKQGMNLLTEVSKPCAQWIMDEWKQEEEERLKTPFDPTRARDMRLINLGKQCKEIGVDIPIDPRFID